MPSRRPAPAAPRGIVAAPAAKQRKRPSPPPPAAQQTRRSGHHAPRLVSPDSVDFRDRTYTPPISHAPAAELAPPPAAWRPVLDQGSTSACTGFALATVVHVLTGRRDEALAAQVSPFMVYGMARRYDNLPGEGAANGSSCRGALKGWHKHGVCARPLWPGLREPAAAQAGWWDEAVQRPLGAYYRVDPRSVVDMQLALSEARVLYASALTHAGWDQGMDLGAEQRGGPQPWRIPYDPAQAQAGGHAFAIVGYSRQGFIVQNSWATDWGSDGLATLAYDDWLANGYDCWVAQLGVVTEVHVAAASGQASEHLRAGATGSSMLDIHTLSPYIVNTENQGELSATGQFHTREQDLDAIVGTMIPEHRQRWGIRAGEPLDLALYAHGGLVSEDAAAQTAALWIPALLGARVFPIFLMWESGLIDTVLDEIKDQFRRQGLVPTGGWLQDAAKWLADRYNDRLEGLGRLVGQPHWLEMKENARLLTDNARGGARLLARKLKPLQGQLRLHLVGHSAGSVVHAHLAELLVRDGWAIESLTLMAAAARRDLFDAKLLPLLQGGRIRRLAQFQLHDRVESTEDSMRPALGYGRSLLYMISNGLEARREVPIIGMQKFFDQHPVLPGLPHVQVRVAPDSAATRATHHGDFSRDAATRASVLAHLAGRPIPR
jgi:predicted alpha/beta hydrolase family esterase